MNLHLWVLLCHSSEVIQEIGRCSNLASSVYWCELITAVFLLVLCSSVCSSLAYQHPTQIVVK